MKPRLLKFTCHSCGARLAVPPEMAGLSDHCPKCGELVTAPAAVAESVAAAPASAPAQAAPQANATAAPAAKSAPEGWSADALADALNPKPAREVQPDLLAPAAQTAASTDAAASPPTMPPLRKPAHEVLDSILKRREPLKATVRAQVPITGEAGAVSQPEEPVLQPGPATALVPQRVTDAQEVERAAMPGMGEVLASAGHAGVASASPESRPLLHVPFVPVRSAPGDERRMRRSQLAIMGIICFVLLDVLLVFLYKDKFFEWLQNRSGDPAPASATADASSPEVDVPRTLAATRPGPVHEEAAPGESKDKPAGDQPATAATPAPSPASGLPLTPFTGVIHKPSESVVPAMAPGTLTIAAPGDFATGPGLVGGTAPAAVVAPVPMAIPLPGHTTQNVPTATPIPAPDKPAATAEMKESSATTTATPISPPPLPPVEPAPPMAEKAVPSTPPPPATPTAASVPAPPPLPPVTVSEPAPETSVVAVSTGTAAPTSAAAEAPKRRIGRVPAEAQSALEALLRFLDAANVGERAALVQNPDTFRTAMERSSPSGDGPILVGQVDFVERYPSKAGVPPYCMFEISDGSLKHPVLVLVEQSSKNGARVDGEAFIEFKDDLLLRFLEKKGAPPQKFRVLLRRKHYFDKDVPDIAGKDSFQLDQPNAHFEGHVFVQRNSALGRQLANQLGWSQDMPVIAELVWKSDAKSWWVELGSIVSYGWRG